MPRYRRKSQIGRKISKAKSMPKGSRYKGKEDGFIRKHWKGLALAGVLFLSALGYTLDGSSGAKTDNLYAKDIVNEYESDLKLYDEEGNETPLLFEDMSKVKAIVSTKDTVEGSNYPVVLVDDSGVMQVGNVDGKYLEEDCEEEITGLTYDTYQEVDMVTYEKGVNLREKPSTDSDVILTVPNESYVLVEDVPIETKDSYAWKQVIYTDGEQYYVGYMASDYMINTDLDKVNSSKYIVSQNCEGLNFREDASTSTDPIAILPVGTEVTIVPNMASVSNGDTVWMPIAVKIDGEVKIGYAAANFKDTAYLELKGDDSAVSIDGSDMVLRTVDTSSDGNVELKLRDNPGTDSNVIMKIENGTTVYTTQDLINEAENSEEINNHKWIKVTLATGESGYVASDFLKERENEKENDGTVSAKFSSQVMEGKFGIDVNTNSMTAGRLDEILSQKAQYFDDNLTGGSVNQTPSFVYIKMGATGWGSNFSLAQDKSYYDKVLSLARVCEKYGVDYGFYYFDQEITEAEADVVADYIEGFWDYAGNLPHNTLKTAIDIEYGGDGNGTYGRMFNYSKAHGKSQVTSTMNYLMNKLRNDTGKGYCIYTDKNSMNDIFNYSDLSEENKADAWTVQVSDSHTDGLPADIKANTRVMQIATDVDGLDYDFMPEK